MLKNETNFDLTVGVRQGGPQAPLRDEVRVQRKCALEHFKPKISHTMDGNEGFYNHLNTVFEVTNLGLGVDGVYIPTLDDYVWRLSFLYSRDVLEFRLIV